MNDANEMNAQENTSDSTEAALACCSQSKQAVCCEPSEKSSCCGPQRDAALASQGKCGCQS